MSSPAGLDQFLTAQKAARGERALEKKKDQAAVSIQSTFRGNEICVTTLLPANLQKVSTSYHLIPNHPLDLPYAPLIKTSTTDASQI